MMLRRLLPAALSLVALTFGIAEASAQDWPSRPIKIVVGFAAGGSTDVTARFIGQALSERLGQPVVIENRPGAAGNIAATAVANADPDGYTLMLATSTTIATNPSLYARLAFDVRRDFAPISLTAFIPNLLVVNPSIPASNVAELIAYLKANPGKVNYGSAGNGSSMHIAAELFIAQAGVQMTHVAYRGGAPAVNDMLTGQLQVIFAPLIEVLEIARANKVRAVGITTTQRSPLFPDVAPVSETLPGYEIALWNGLFAPSRTPREIVDRINKAVVDALKSPHLRAQLANLGSEPVGSSADEFKTFIDAELEKWRRLVQISGAKIE